MITITRFHVITVAVIIILLSVGQLLHYHAVDADVLRYVSTKAKQGSDTLYDKFAKPSGVSSTVAMATTTVYHTSTVTHTTEIPGPTPEPEQCEECHERYAMHVNPFSALNMTVNLPKNIPYEPKGPKNNEIVILTATDGGGHNDDIPNMVKLAVSNREEYCKLHNYTHHFIDLGKFDLDDIHAVWKKLPAVVETFNTYPEAQWVFWLDLDAIIMTPQQDLQSLILSRDGMKKNSRPNAELIGGGPEETRVYFPPEPDYENMDFIIGQDHNGVNAGSFLLRRSAFTQFFLDLWADPFFMYASFGMREQDVITHLLKHHKVVRDHTLMARLRAINANVEGGDWMSWQEGDLLVHMAGCWVTDACAERWNKFWNLKAPINKRDGEDMPFLGRIVA